MSSTRTIEDLRADHIGKRVLITGKDHPSRNMSGEVVSFDHTAAGLMMGVRLDDEIRSLLDPKEEA